MNRTDRLYALREELRRAGRGGRGAAQLAEVFEVSARTIKRDMAALQHSGFPVGARPGPGGGYTVAAAATLPPVNLTDAEVSGLATAVAAHQGQPFYHHARTAIVKLLGVVTPQQRERAITLSDRLWVDHTEPAPAARICDSVEQALHQQRVISLRYQDRHGDITTRSVDPILLAHTHARWYLVARCQTVQDIRWFRLDRIRAAHTTAQPAADIPIEAVGSPPPTARAAADV